MKAKKLEIPEFDMVLVQLTGRQLEVLQRCLQDINEEIISIKNEMINLHYPSPYFTAQQTMEYLSIGRKKLWELERDGIIVAYTIGGSFSSKSKRFKRKELDALITRKSF